MSGSARRLIESTLASSFGGPFVGLAYNALSNIPVPSVLDAPEQSASSSSSSPAPDWSTLLKQGFDSLGTSLNSALASALDKEFVASAQANQFAQESAQKAMDFTAEQNAINRVFQQSSAERAMQFSADEAQKSRDWQQKMSDTSYQRAVADLQAAGLNPILAVTAGGASTPAGAAGSGYAASGSAGSGSAAAAAKADAAGGKNADTQYLSIIFNSAASLLNAIGEIIPG